MFTVFNSSPPPNRPHHALGGLSPCNHTQVPPPSSAPQDDTKTMTKSLFHTGLVFHA